MAPDDVGELAQLDLGIGIERIDVVNRDVPRGFIPFVVARIFIGLLDIVIGLIVGAKEADIGLGIAVPHRFVGKEAQRLMIADRPGDFLVDIGFKQLRPPIAVVGPQQAADADVVEQARQHHLFGQAVFLRQRGALQHVVHRTKALFIKFHQGRLVRHARQPRVMPHHIGLFLTAAFNRMGQPFVAAIGRTDARFNDGAIELFGHRMFQRVGALHHRHRGQCARAADRCDECPAIHPASPVQSCC